MFIGIMIENIDSRRGRRPISPAPRPRRAL